MYCNNKNKNSMPECLCVQHDILPTYQFKSINNLLLQKFHFTFLCGRSGYGSKHFSGRQIEVLHSL